MLAGLIPVFHGIVRVVLAGWSTFIGVSQSPRNGDERYLSLGYGSTMAKLLNNGKPQPAAPIAKLLAKAKKQHAAAAAVVARGVAGKYQAQRKAQVAAYSHSISVLEGLSQKT